MTESGTGTQKEAVHPPPANRTRSFLWNAIAVVIVGTAVYFWTDYYTDHLPTIATLVGGGGVLAWLSTTFSFFRAERREELVNWAEMTIFSSRWFSVTLALAFFALLVAATQFGGVQIQSLAEESEHSVQVWSSDAPATGFAQLAPGEHIRRIVFTPLLSKRSVHVHVKGFPEKVVEVRPMQRVTVYVPNSVRTPVILVRPTISLMDAARTAEGAAALFKLEVDWKDAEGRAIHRVVEFDGQHSILVGGDEDIAIPTETMDMWRAEAEKRRDALAAWRSVIAPEEFSAAMSQGQTVVFTLRQAQCPSDGTQAPKVCPIYNGPFSYKVKAVRGSQPYIQEVQLDIPRDST
jgi:hypothetical protein